MRQLWLEIRCYALAIACVLRCGLSDEYCRHWKRVDELLDRAEPEEPEYRWVAMEPWPWLAERDFEEPKTRRYRAGAAVIFTDAPLLHLAFETAERQTLRAHPQENDQIRVRVEITCFDPAHDHARSE